MRSLASEGPPFLRCNQATTCLTSSAAGMAGVSRDPAVLIVDALLLRLGPVARTRIELAQVQDGSGAGQQASLPFLSEQLLESLALVAVHTPAPLLQALLKWRLSEGGRTADSPRGSAHSPTQHVQRKLAVECIFTSACLRLVDSCAANGLSDELWTGLEEYVLDWLIYSDRFVPHAESSPALVEARQVLLDLLAQLAGALSGKRFASITNRFFHELDARTADGPSPSPSPYSNSQQQQRLIPVGDLFLLGGKQGSLLERGGFPDPQQQQQQHQQQAAGGGQQAVIMKAGASKGGDAATSSRTELLTLVHGMRFMRLSMSSPSEINASRIFVARTNPLLRASSASSSSGKGGKQRTVELQQALCSMLASVLAPLADLSTPRGRPPKASGESLTAWNAAVLQLRAQLHTWMDKQGSLTLQMEKPTRHIQVALPLITTLLCLGDQPAFEKSFSSLLDLMYKQLKEKNLRGIALDCLQRLTHFYLSVYAPVLPKRDVAEVLQGITQQLMNLLKSSSSSGGTKGGQQLQEMQQQQQERIVDFCATIAASNLDFAMSEIVLVLLKAPGLGEAKVVGLRALLAVVQSVLQQQAAASSASSSLVSKPRSLSASSSGPSRTGSVSYMQRASVDGSLSSTSLSSVSSIDPAVAESVLLAPHLERVRVALGAIIKLCHSNFGQMLLISTKTFMGDSSGGAGGKGGAQQQQQQQQQGWQVFRLVLKCVPHLIPQQWRKDKMTEIIPVYAISVDPGVREEAAQVLFRTVRDLPQCRFPILRGMANFILRIPDEYPLLIHSSLTRLVSLLHAWRACLARQDEPPVQRQSSEVDGNDEVDGALFDSSGMDAVGIIFLCSADVQIRRTSLELLRSVQGLQQDLLGGEEEPPGEETVYVIDVMEESGEDIVAASYMDKGRWQDFLPDVMCREDAIVPPGLTLMAVLEANDRGRWGRCLSGLAKYCAELCPTSVQGARLEVVARMQTLDPAGTDGAAGGLKGSLDTDAKLEQWQMYAMFVCACPPEETSDGGLVSIKELLRLILPLARSGHEPLMHAALLALGSSHAEICEAMLTELAAWVEEVNAEMESRKWKPTSGGGKLRRDDLRSFVANVYRLVAQNLWPGVIKNRPWLRQQYVRFVGDTTHFVMSAAALGGAEAFPDTQVLRFALAAVVNALGVEIVVVAADRFDSKWRKRLYDLFSSWCSNEGSDTSGGGGANGGSGGGSADYWREVERCKQAALAKCKEAAERAAVEKELNDQARAIGWMAMQAMATLLYGPCFDDNVRKMLGRVVDWIKGLMMDPTGGVVLPPLPGESGGGGPTRARSPEPSPRRGGFGSLGLRPSTRPAGGSVKKQQQQEKEQQQKEQQASERRSTLRGGASALQRAILGREALLNLLQTNLDLLPAVIDQCYNADTALANSYYTVLAEVYMRYECPACQPQRLLSLILYKAVDPSRRIRDDALQMLETLSLREWWADRGSGDSGGRSYRAAVVGSLPDSYQQFQYQLSAKLASERPELTELLCEEIMQRQLDALDIIAQHQVLTCLAPWMENLNLMALWDSGWSERLLKSLYYVTWRHGDHFPDEIEKLWATIAGKPKNIVPVLDFLISKGVEDCDSNAFGEMMGAALVTYFSVAKRICLYLARVSPQNTIDHLVFELGERLVEEEPEGEHKLAAGEGGGDIGGLRYNGGGEDGLADYEVLEFSQGPPPQIYLPPLAATAPPQVFDAGTPVLTPSPSFSETSAVPPPHRRQHSLSMPWSRGATAGGKQQAAGGGGAAGGWTTPGGTSLSKATSSSMKGGGRHSHKNSMDGTSTDGGGTFGTSSGAAWQDSASASTQQAWGEAPTTPRGGGNASPLLPLDDAQLLTRADIGLILLAEIAYENDEDFRSHLPLLFHVAFCCMDSSEAIVLEHAQQLLVNLLYTLAGRHMELLEGRDQQQGRDGEYKQQAQVVTLIKFVQAKQGSLMWAYEEMQPPLLSSLVSSVVDAIFFQSDLRERWGEEALRWAMECSSRHVACRSHQIFRALRPAVKTGKCVALLRCLQRCLAGTPTLGILGVVQEIILSLQVMVEVMDADKMIIYPQLFWGCVALLYTNYVHVYAAALDLLLRILDHLSLGDPTHENVLLAAMPRHGGGLSDDDVTPGGNRGTPVWEPAALDGLVERRPGLGGKKREREEPRSREGEVGGGTAAAAGGGGGGGGDLPPFVGLQPLVLKGLLSPVSHNAAIDVLSRFTLLRCDRILGDGETRLLMHCVGLLPWLCLQLGLPRKAGGGLQQGPVQYRMGGGAGAQTNHFGLSASFVPSSALPKQLQKARAVAANVAQCCFMQQQGLQDLGLVFSSYADGRLLRAEDLLERAAPLLVQRWFPEHAGQALGHLLLLLDKGPADYQHPVLLLLRCLLPIQPSEGGEAPLSPLLYSAVSQLLDSPGPEVRREAQCVLEAILEQTHGPSQGHAGAGSSGVNGRESQRSSKAGNGMKERGAADGLMQQQHRATQSVSGNSWVSSGRPSIVIGGASASDILPSREAALLQVRAALAGALGTYDAPARRKDPVRLVPFVDNAPPPLQVATRSTAGSNGPPPLSPLGSRRTSGFGHDVAWADGGQPMAAT